MRRYLLLGTGLALLAGGTALAQMPPPNPPPNPSQGGMAPGGMPGGMGPHDMAPHDMDSHDMDHDHMNRDGHGPDRAKMMHDWHMSHMRHREAEAAGAAFRLRRGNMEIDIRCSASEPTMACINGAATLIDRLNGNAAPTTPASQGGATPSAEPGSPPAPRTP